MSKTKKIISLVLAALLIMAMATVAVSAMSADEIHVVAGEAGLCGSGWDPADTNNQMTYNAEKDIYEKVFTGIAAGTYAFKVTTNYGWDNGDFNLEGDAMYGGPNASVTVDADGSTVIVGFNGMHATVEVVAGTDTPVDPTTAPADDATTAPADDATTAPADDATTAPADDVTDAPVVVDTITFYFTNNKGWAAVNAHTWDSNGALDAGWPGAAMTFVETNDFGEDIYSITVPASATGVVFNAGEGQAQTTDVAPENGKGYYCVEQDAEGKWTVESYDYIVVDPTTAAPVETTTAAPVETTTEAPVETTTEAPVETTTAAPVETTTAAPVETTTAAPVETTTAAPVVTDAPAEGNGVTVGGVEYGVTEGDIITYTYVLTTPAPIENVQATTYYDAAKLELIEGKAKEMFPVLRDITSVVYNTDIAGQVKFNATEGVEEGFDFTQGGVLVTLQFKVLDTTPSEIYTVIEEMVKFCEKVDYATGGEIVADGVTYVETLTGNTPPTTAPTTTEKVEPTTTEVVPTTTEKVEPTTTEVVPTTTEKVEPTTTEVVPTTTEKAEPTEGKTDAPAPGTDATSATEAGTTAPKADAPATGAAAYIYVVVAVLAMAACAVVVLRKRVNG